MGLVPWHVGSSRTRDQTCVSCIGRWILHQWATREALDLCFFFLDLCFLNECDDSYENGLQNRAGNRYRQTESGCWGRRETWRERMRWKNKKHSEGRDDRLCWCGTRGKVAVDLQWILGFGLKQGDGGVINWDGKKQIWGWKESNAPYNKFKLSTRHLNSLKCK